MASGKPGWRGWAARIWWPLLVTLLSLALLFGTVGVALGCAPQYTEPGAPKDESLRGMATYESVVVIHLNGNTYYVYEGSRKCCLLDVERGTGAPKD